MTEPNDRDDDTGLHRLNTAQADLAGDLRALFAPLLGEAVPADLMRLGADLDAKLAREGGAADAGRERPAEAGASSMNETGASGRVVRLGRLPPEA